MEELDRGLARQGAAVDVFLRLDRSVKASEGSEGHRKISSARAPSIIGHRRILF